MSEVPARCAPFEEDLSALLDGQLDAARAAEVRAHIASCADCTRRADALRGIDVALRSLAATPISAAQRARMRPVLAPERAAHRAPPRRRRWLAPAALVATAAAAAAVVLVLRPIAPDPEVAVARQVPAITLAEAKRLAQETTEALDGVKVGAAVAPERGEAVTNGGGTAANDMLADVPDEDLALATELFELPALDSPRDLEVVEQLDLIETLGALDAMGTDRG